MQKVITIGYSIKSGVTMFKHFEKILADRVSRAAMRAALVYLENNRERIAESKTELNLFNSGIKIDLARVKYSAIDFIIQSLKNDLKARR